MTKGSLSLCFAAALCISATSLHALPFADSVTSFSGGAGFGVDDGIAEEGGTFYPGAATALDGIVLGLGGTAETPGTITMRFSNGEVIDGAGPDLRLYDTFSFKDGFNLEISADGSRFTQAFFFAGDLLEFSCSLESPCVADVDISGTGQDAFSYLRITAAGNIAQGFPQAYTLDAAEALNYRSISLPEPGTLALFGLAFTGLVVFRRAAGSPGVSDRNRSTEAF